MINTILNAFTAGATIAATVLSAISVFYLMKENKRRSSLEPVNLTIVPKDKLSNCVDEIFFLNLAFSNESSLPISILDMYISVPKEGTITNSKSGPGGYLLPHPVSVSKSTSRYPDVEIIKYDLKSAQVPVTIAPFSSHCGYFAFHAGRQDSAIISHKTLLLRLYTSRGMFDIELSLIADNFMDLIYKHDGTVKSNIRN